MRTVDVSLAGAVYAMPVSFAAIEKVASRVGDPFALSLGMTRGETLSLLQTVETIAIGASLAGCKLTREEVGQAITEAGAQDFLKVASSYVIALVSGGPSAPMVGAKKKGR